MVIAAPTTSSIGAPPVDPASGLAGLTHAATVSFLAGRLTPTGAFWVSLAGGVALARAAGRCGGRAGYGASIAAMVETVAVMGPARIAGPLTQALNAPALGALHARGRGFAVLLGACTGIRLAHYVVINALLVFVVIGGVDAYVDTYDRIVELTFGVLPSGATAALVLTVISNLVAAVFYSAVQVVVCRRALREDELVVAREGTPFRMAQAARPPRTPIVARALAGATVALWALLLAVLSWPVLAVATALVAGGTLTVGARRRRALRLGFALGLALALGALVPGLLGAVPLDDAAMRAVRALLLVGSAALAQAIVGPDGVRALAAAALHAARRLPGAREAAALAPGLRADRRLIPATRELLARVGEVAPAPGPLADVVIAWVRDEQDRGP